MGVGVCRIPNLELPTPTTTGGYPERKGVVPIADGSSRGHTYKQNRLLALQRDNYICVYCGNEATTADHVVPVASGGSDDLSNLVAACISCNSSKGKKEQVRVNYVNRRWLTNL